jgi:hypothetical protein
MINVTHWPVVIYANYRTGSSALGHSLANHYNCKFYDDPFYKKTEFDRFTQHYNSTDTRYIVKFMGDHVYEDDLYNNLLAMDAFKIRLYRENKIEQISSYYISLATRRWHTIDNSTVNNYNLPLNILMLKESIRRIQHNDQLLDAATVKFNVTTIYELLGFLKNTPLILTKPPENIKTIQNLIRSMLNIKLKD